MGTGFLTSYAFEKRAYQHGSSKTGRRSCAEQREAAALFLEAARKVHLSVSNGLLYDGFFLLPSSGSKHLFQ